MASTNDDLIRLDSDTGASGGRAQPQTWDFPTTMKWLETLQLPPEALAKFTDVEITGQDLVSMTVDELKAELGLTKLQAIRVKRALAGDRPAADEEAQAKDLAAAKDASKTGAAAPPADLLELDVPAATQAMKSLSVSRATVAPAPAAVAVAAAAAAAPTPAPAVAATPAALGVSAALVHEWEAKTALIAKLEGEQVALQLPAAQQRLAYLQQAVAAETKTVAELQAAYNKLDAKAKEIVDEDAWYPGKVLMGAKRRDEKKAEAQGQAKESEQKLRAETQVLKEQQIKLQNQQQVVAELTGKVASLNEAKRWEADALQNAFAGVAGDPEENRLEGEVSAIVPKLDSARAYKMSYSQAFELVRTGRKQLQGAEQLFQAAFGLSGLDVLNDFRGLPMHNTMGGVMVDCAKRARVEQAVGLCHAAADAIVKAKQIIPDMPRVELRKIKGLKEVSGLMDVVFDNIVTDMRSRREIQDCMAKVAEQLKDVVYAERWLEGWLQGRIDVDLRALESSFAAKKSELDAYRRDLFRKMAEA